MSKSKEDIKLLMATHTVPGLILALQRLHQAREIGQYHFNINQHGIGCGLSIALKYTDDPIVIRDYIPYYENLSGMPLRSPRD